MHTLLRGVVLFVLLFSLSGCLLLKRGPTLEPQESYGKIAREVKKLEVTPASLLKPIHFNVKCPPGIEEDGLAFLKKKWISLSLFNAPLSSTEMFLQKKLHVPVVVSLKKKDPRVTISYRGNGLSFLRYLSEKFDLWVYKKNGVVVISDTRPFSVTIPLITRYFSGNMKQADIQVSAENKDMFEDIKKMAKKLGIEINVFSSATGFLQVEGSPSALKRFVEYLNQEVKEASKFVAIRILIFQLTISRENATSFSLSRVLDLFGEYQGLVTVSSAVDVGQKGVQALKISKGAKGEFLTAFFQYVSNFGTTEIVSAPTLITANGNPAVLEVKKDAGWWEPGDIETFYGVAGDQTSQQRMGRPTWKDDSVGLTILIRPKFVDDQTINLDILYKNSSVYAYSTYPYTPFPDKPDLQITLQHPMKEESSFLTRALVKRGEALLVAGLKREERVAEEGFVSMLNNRRAKKETYLFVVVALD